MVVAGVVAEVAAGTWLEPVARWRLWAAPFALALFLIAVAQFNFLAFHTLAELFAIVISFVMFAFAWSTRDLSKNYFLLFLACGYFWIGSLDLMHTLVYKGMDVLVEGSGNLSVQFWIATRYCEALLLLAAPFAATRKLNGMLLLGVFGVVAGVLTTLIMSGNFPTGFVEGSGLTDFKIYSEYLIVSILLLALVNLFRRGVGMSGEEKSLILISIALTIVAELAFTFYVSVYGASNLVGHIFKLFSFWFIYQAIVISNLNKPYAALVVAHKELDKFFSLSFDMQCIAGFDGYFKRLNPAWATTLGYSLEELQAEPFVGFVHPDDVAHTTQAAEKLGEGGVVVEFENRYRTKSGAYEWLMWNGIADVDAGLIYATAHKITTRKQYEQQLEETVRLRTKDLEKEIAERMAMQEQLIQSSKMATLGEMATGVAHELNQPLNVIRLLMANIQSKSDSNNLDAAFLQGKLDKTCEMVERAASVIDHMRIFGRNPDRDTALLDPAKMVANVLGLIGEQLRLSGIEVRTADETSGTFVRGHQVQIEQVLLNLLANARDVMEDRDVGEKRITIRICEQDGGERVRIELEDTGGGIAPESLDRVFEPFYTTKEIGKGTGLGLSISYGIITEMGGTLEARNSEAGACFSILLPRATEEQAA